MSKRTQITLVAGILLLLFGMDIQAADSAKRIRLKTGPVQSKSTENKIIFEYEFAVPKVSKVLGYDLLEMEGLDLFKQIGAPVVPMRMVSVSVPFGKQVYRLKYRETSKRPCGKSS